MALSRTLILLLVVAPLAGAAELTTLDNKKATGEIVGFKADGLVFRNGAADETYEYTKLDAVTLNNNPGDPPGKWIEVELIDGTNFRCTDFRIKKKTAVLTLATKNGPGQMLEFPANNVLYMIRDLSDPKYNQAFRNILSKRGKLDKWIVESKDKTTLDGLDGTFSDGDEKGEIIQFEIVGQPKTPIQFTTLYGAIFSSPPEIQVAQTVCRVIDLNKNVLNARSIKLTEQKSVIIETTTGVKIEYPALTAIAKFDFSAGAMRFLSALNPIKVEMSDPVGLPPEPYRRDRSLDNDMIRIEKTPYTRGLAIHSKTVLTYDLAGQYKIFQALAGIDDCVEGENEVTLTIETDLAAKPLFKEVFKKGETKPKQLNLNVLNVKQLKITVESNFLVGGQLDLAEAKVLK